MRNLRLLLWEDCDRSCEGCCNKDWNLKALPDFTPDSTPLFDLIMLTGGEVLLDAKRLTEVAREIRAYMAQRSKMIFYTAKPGVLAAMVMQQYFDGIPVTLHEPGDVVAFNEMEAYVYANGLTNRLLRLNVFNGIEAPKFTRGWVVKAGVDWIPDCPLPKNEVFERWRW